MVCLKFYEDRLKDEKWYKYEGNAITWYHIYSAKASFHEAEANDYKELAAKNIAPEGTPIEQKYRQIYTSVVGGYVLMYSVEENHNYVKQDYY